MGDSPGNLRNGRCERDCLQVDKGNAGCDADAGFGSNRDSLASALRNCKSTTGRRRHGAAGIPN